MKKDITIRRYQPGDEEALVKLLQLVFDGWPHIDLECTPLEHWKWKYLDNPSASKRITIALYDDEIVGVDHSIPVRIKIGDELQYINYTADLAVHPSYRREGIAKKMIDMNDDLRREAGLEGIYFVTRRSFIIKNYSKPFPFPVLNLVRINDIDKQLKMMPVKNPSFMKFGFHMSKIFNSIQNVFSGSYPSKKDLNILEVKKFDDKIDRFFENVSNHYNFIVERSHQYLNWRYCDTRSGKFIIEKVEDNDQILGFCVLRINRYLKNYPIGFIVDLLTLPDRFDVVDTLISEVVHYFDKNNINIVNCLIVKDHPYENLLKKYGFLNSRIRFQIITNFELINKNKLLKDSLPREIYFSYGDIDSLPIRMPNY